MAEGQDTQRMITELYNKIILKTDRVTRPRKVSLRQYFIMSYVKEGLYRDMTPFEMTRGSLDDVLNLAAQITFKNLTIQQKHDVEKDYSEMTNDQLDILKAQ